MPRSRNPKRKGPAGPTPSPSDRNPAKTGKKPPRGAGVPRRGHQAAAASAAAGVAAGRGDATERPGDAGQPPPGPADPIQTMLRAASFAARKHRDQTRQDGMATPYFAHVARVTLVLSVVFGVRDEDLLAAALLHDTLEDTATDYDEIAEQFGPAVAGMVVALTKNGMLPKEEREREYHARLCAAPEPVRVAKLADVYDNLSDRRDARSAKLETTVANARRLLAAFADLMETETGRRAHALVSGLLAETVGPAA